jgi:ribonuclease D
MNAIAKILQPQQTHAIGLKQLTKTYLNYNLVKSQQMSNWAKRPLTPHQVIGSPSWLLVVVGICGSLTVSCLGVSCWRQIHYAACDALVLIRLYDAMTMEVADLFGEYDFSSCYKNYQRLPHDAEEAAKRKQKHRRHSQSPKKLVADASASDAATTASECSESNPSEAETGGLKKRKAA